MAVYKFSARNTNGIKVNDFVNAPSNNEALIKLAKRGLSKIKLTNLTDTLELKILVLINRVTTKDLVIFSRQFAVMISASLPLVQALRITADQTKNISLKMIISDMASEIDEGSRLSDALQKRVKVFSQFYVSVVKSGEKSGKLDDVLNYLADEMERNYDIKSKIKGAMIYPAFVLVALGAVGVIMMMFVVPKLINVIQKSGGTLPLPTRIVIGTSDFLIDYWWIILLIIFGLRMLFKVILKTELGAYYFDLLKFKLPVFGKIYTYIYVVYFSSSMHTLLIGGVQISASLEIVADIIDNNVYKKLLNTASKRVHEGESISNTLMQSKEIPDMVSQMISVGEKTGKMDMVLKKINEFYNRELSTLLDNLMTLLEPIVIVILGIAVAIMVAAIILPMYSVGSQF